MSHNNHLKPEQLRQKTDAALFTFESTEELEPLERIIGQDRAVTAIDFGVEIPSKGYNIYAVGPPGSGRTTAVRRFLNQRAAGRPAPPDWCYVYNFDEPRQPRALQLPSGRANELRRKMEELVERIQDELPRMFEGQSYEERRREFMQEMQERQMEIYQNLENYLNERGFALIRSQAGLAIAPMLNGEVLSAEDYQKLDPEIKKRFEDHRPELQREFDEAMRKARQLDRESKEALERINAEMVGFLLDTLMADIREAFEECPQVLEHLNAVRADIISNLNRLMPRGEGQQQQLPFGLSPQRQQERAFDRYAIGVLAQNESGQPAPVIIEDNPNYHNLLGRIEHRTEMGTMVTDFRQIRPGALHRANGGYLVVEARGLLTNAMAYDALKRALRNNEIKIEEMAQFFGLVATVSLEPEPIPLDVKVVIIGDHRLYQVLYAMDEEFRELFKVKAEFVMDMSRDENSLQDLAGFVGDLCRRESLIHFAPEAVARLAEESSRAASDQEKLSTHFASMADLVRESSYHANRAGHSLTQASDIQNAVDDKRRRLDYVKQRYLEVIRRGTILVQTEGAIVGQTNALSVAQSADFIFGLPSRISARTFMGRSSVVSVEREVKLSGPIHGKGNMILSSYLAGRFAQQRPLTMSASLTFEQNYSGVEGDSASSTELYSILSSLADVPIKQSFAVTGSVSQSGQVQAIGGVNAKIEGFFDLCRERGLTGDQGVLIPQSNVRNLMLRSDVVEAVEQGQFHICAVSTIEEGIELLTGMPAGEEDEEGNYPEGTLYALVKKKLDTYAERMKRVSQPQRNDNQGSEQESEPEEKSDDEDDLPDPDIPVSS